jgi:kynurenine formamidase
MTQVAPIRIVDLSWPLEPGMPHLPAHPAVPVFLSGTLSHGMTARLLGEDPVFGRVSFANEQIVISGHMGTHVDAPSHADRHGVSIEATALSDTVGWASWVDVSVTLEKGIVTASDLDAAVGDRHIEPRLLLHTGSASMLATDPRAYWRDHAGLDASAAEWIRERGIVAVGVDAPSPDRADDPLAPAHMRFLRPQQGEHTIAIVENLANIPAIGPPMTPFVLVAAPLPLQGSTGSPVRALALVWE